MKIAIGCDEAGFEMKNILKQLLIEEGHSVKDFGAFDLIPVLYPDIAYAVAQSVASGANERAVLICGTGIGMAIVANKVAGIRAAQAHDHFSAERARMSNNAQIITFGARVIGIELAKSILKTWLKAEFVGGGSAPKVALIAEYEQKGLKK
ncbi:ribose 5-phosphate isomerase B/allose 6-phosphate isomerase [Gammaproteobacteria bacterium]|nr:ribose 5-phosphate isomerase B/allose 6-phosphate isomerase [Gammaproteobacteria bacterium]